MTVTGYSNFKMNGVSLQTYGWNFEVLDGLAGMPGRRGSNRSTPYQDGDFSYGEKFFGSRLFAAQLHVYPQDADGVVNGVDGARYNLNANMDYLKGVFNQNAGLQLFSYEVKDGVGGSVTRDIDVEILAGFTFTEESKSVMTATVVMNAPRPFWREKPLTTVNRNAITVFPDNFNIDTLGNAPIGDLIITIDVNAASSTPSLECVSTGDKITFNDPSLILNDQIVIDLGARTFKKNTVRADALVQRTSTWFMRLPTAASLAMKFDVTSGNYDLQLDYYRKWL